MKRPEADDHTAARGGFIRSAMTGPEGLAQNHARETRHPFSQLAIWAASLRAGGPENGPLVNRAERRSQVIQVALATTSSKLLVKPPSRPLLPARTGFFWHAPAPDEVPSQDSLALHRPTLGTFG